MSNRLQYRADVLNLHLHAGHALRVLRGLRSRSISCIVTSPPYFDHIIYDGGPGNGNEETVEEYIKNLAAIFRGCMRVLRDDGTLWIVIGETWRGGEQLGIADLVALTLTEQGWIRRHRLVWDKGSAWVNPKIARYAHEDILVFSKRRNNWFVHAKALLEPSDDPVPPTNIEHLRYRIDSSLFVSDEAKRKAHADLDGYLRDGCTAIDMRLPGAQPDHRGSTSGTGKRGRAFQRGEACFYPTNPGGTKWGSVWRFAPESYPPHPCVLPIPLCERCIEATCPPDGIVLDPFVGVGSVAVAAGQLRRRFIGIDTHEPYLRIAERRLREAVPGSRVLLW